MKSLPKLERTTDEASDQATVQGESIHHSKTRQTKFLQGTAVFIVMYVALWWLLSRGEERLG